MLTDERGRDEERERGKEREREIGKRKKEISALVKASS